MDNMLETKQVAAVPSGELSPNPLIARASKGEVMVAG